MGLQNESEVYRHGSQMMEALSAEDTSVTVFDHTI
jgi:hypothetical protein